MIQEVILYLVGFAIFCVLQSFFINGLFESMRGKCVNDLNKGEVCSGNILYPFKRWISKYVSEYWMSPIADCVKCMSSLYGTITFWATTLPLFGFHFYMIWVWVCDIFILCALNYLIYKKL